MASQKFFMSATEFIRTQGTVRLEQICSHREEVHETISYETETTRILTVIEEYTCLVKMQVGTGEATVVRVIWQVYENRNSYHWRFAPATAPRQFFAAYSSQLEGSRDTGHISSAFFARPPSVCGFQEIAPTGSY